MTSQEDVAIVHSMCHGLGLGNPQPREAARGLQVVINPQRKIHVTSAFVDESCKVMATIYGVIGVL